MLSNQLLHAIKANTTRFLTVVLTTIGLIASTTNPALAETSTIEEISEESISQEDTLRSESDEYIIAACAGTIYNGTGSIECAMPYGNMWTSIKILTGHNGGMTGSVECFVEFPTGATYDLGTIALSDGEAISQEYFFCPYGIYTFYFDAATTTPFNVSAYIFEY